jgi:chloramphenicol-sensitive protein RarD
MIYAFLAYFLWGFFPIYWKFLKHVPTAEILAHRLLWSFIFYTLVLFIQKRKLILFKPPNKKSMILLACASSVLMLNWMVYIWAVNSNQIIESSLGYFINPLVNILFGVFLLNEKLNRDQIFSVILASLGVLVIAWDQGHIPWIALILAVSFAIYGLLKKKTHAKGVESNQFEAVIFIPLVLAFLFFQPHTWVTADNQTSSFLLLAGAGIVTGLPLILFAEAAKRIPYYLMGFFQFIAPTLQFASGVLIFNEPLSENKLIGFAIIWLAILYLAGSSFYRARKAKVKVY